MPSGLLTGAPTIVDVGFTFATVIVLFVTFV